MSTDSEFSLTYALVFILRPVGPNFVLIRLDCAELAFRGEFFVLNRLVCGVCICFLLAAPATAQTITLFEAELTPEAVILAGERPSAGISEAFGTAQFTLTQPVFAPATLSYSIQLTGVDLEGTQSPGFPDDDVTALHFHDTTQCPPMSSSCIQGTDTVGTMHVLNVYGFPREDDADVDVDAAAGLITGIWDDGDENLAFPPSNALTGFTDNGDAILDLLFDELLFVNVHTNAFNAGEIGGYIRLVPEPGSWGMLLLSLAGFRRLRTLRRQ